LTRLGQIKPLKPLQPMKLPGDVESRCTQYTCKSCGNILGKADPNSEKVVNMTCSKCGFVNTDPATELTNFTPDKPGKQYNPNSTNNNLYLPKGRPVAAFNLKRIVEAKKDKEDKKEVRVKDTFMSEEIKQCPDLSEVTNKRKGNEYVDKDLEVMKSCEDLMIDG